MTGGPHILTFRGGLLLLVFWQDEVALVSPFRAITTEICQLEQWLVGRLESRAATDSAAFPEGP